MAGKKRKRVVIIGNSAAGLSALEAFKMRDVDSKAVLIDQEPYPAYSRVITPYFIMGGIKQEQSLFLRDKSYYKDLGIKTLFGTKVLKIDTQFREVLLDNGKREPFDLLLIAAGSSPIKPKIRGAKAGDIGVLRSLDDARQLRELKPNIEKGLFLGGGLVSLQTLQALYRRGGRYTLLMKSDRILSQTLDQEASEMVAIHLKKMEVGIMKGRDVIQLKRKKGSMTALLDNGDEVETDFIFAGKGVEPNIDFLKGSGIKTKKGVLVNGQMETNIEGIYAAGDVAMAPDFLSGESVIYGLWFSAVEQGEIAGKNMAGLRQEYSGNLKMNVTSVFAMPIVSIGDIGSGRVSEAFVKKDEKRNIYRKICLDERGTIIGAILINQVDDLGIIRGLIRERKAMGVLKASSRWGSPITYGFVHKNNLQGRL